MVRITIREFALLGCVLGLGFAWWLDRCELRDDLRSTRQRVVELRLECDTWRKRFDTFEEQLENQGFALTWVPDATECPIIKSRLVVLKLPDQAKQPATPVDATSP